VHPNLTSKGELLVAVSRGGGANWTWTEAPHDVNRDLGPTRTSCRRGGVAPCPAPRRLRPRVDAAAGVLAAGVLAADGRVGDETLRSALRAVCRHATFWLILARPNRHTFFPPVPLQLYNISASFNPFPRVQGPT